MSARVRARLPWRWRTNCRSPKSQRRTFRRRRWPWPRECRAQWVRRPHPLSRRRSAGAGCGRAVRYRRLESALRAGERPRLALDVEVRDYEPAQALFAGEDGLAIYRRLIPAAFGVLVPGGFVALEIGYGQQEAIQALLAAAGFSGSNSPRIYRDSPRGRCPAAMSPVAKSCQEILTRPTSAKSSSCPAGLVQFLVEAEIFSRRAAW